MLRREGFESLQAGSGEEALELLAAESVDLLVTDVGMGPSMNGWELAERVRDARLGPVQRDERRGGQRDRQPVARSQEVLPELGRRVTIDGHCGRQEAYRVPRNRT